MLLAILPTNPTLLSAIHTDMVRRCVHSHIHNCCSFMPSEMEAPLRRVLFYHRLQLLLYMLGKCRLIYYSFFLFLKNKFIYLFLAALGLCCCTWAFLVVASGGYSLLRWSGFSLQWLLLLWSMGSRRMGFSSCGSRALERRLRSCGSQA